MATEILIAKQHLKAKPETPIITKPAGKDQSPLRSALAKQAVQGAGAGSAGAGVGTGIGTGSGTGVGTGTGTAAGACVGTGLFWLQPNSRVAAARVKNLDARMFMGIPRDRCAVRMRASRSRATSQENARNP